MCKRYSQPQDMRLLSALWRAQGAGVWSGSYNIAPGQPVPVLTEHRGLREIRVMTWDAVTPTVSAEELLAESVSDDLRAATHCVLPAEGFYAWVQDISQPWYFFPPRDGLAMAALSRRSRDAQGKTSESVSLVTAPASEAVIPVADRMPALLQPEELGLWCSAMTKGPALTPLLRPVPANALTAHMVSTHVNNLANTGPACISARSARAY